MKIEKLIKKMVKICSSTVRCKDCDYNRDYGCKINIAVDVIGQVIKDDVK